MIAVPFAFYDSFTDVPFGGSPAAVVTDAAGIDAETRFRIAKEIGAPATGFVSSHDDSSVTVQFFSTIMELPMCGHGTMALMTRMVELGVCDWTKGDELAAELRLPKGNATVELTRQEDDRPVTMLDVKPSGFRTDNFDPAELARLLGIETGDFAEDRPLETAVADFVHLVVPTRGLDAMRRITPDFDGIIRFCHAHGIETVVAFSTEVEQEGRSVHVRDFCPAVGVAESAAAGTTNGVLTSYLVRHGIVAANDDGQVHVHAEQGMEIGRPSSVRSVATLQSGSIERLQVGGMATKIMDGELHL